MSVKCIKKFIFCGLLIILVNQSKAKITDGVVLIADKKLNVDKNSDFAKSKSFTQSVQFETTNAIENNENISTHTPNMGALHREPVTESSTNKIEENSRNYINIETTSILNIDLDTTTLFTDEAPKTTTPTASNCTTPGLRAHENDCYKYYECSSEGSQDGSLHLITKSCPERQAFSVELNNCSRDISSCNLDIKCVTMDTIIDISSNSYYICEPRLFGDGFHIYRVFCTPYENFNYKMNGCYVNLEYLPKYNWEAKKDIDFVKADIKLFRNLDKLKYKQAKKLEKEAQKKAKEIEKDKKKKAKDEAAAFECVKEGNFASKIDNKFFISCITKKNKLKAMPMQCPSGLTFLEVLGSCVYVKDLDKNSNGDSGKDDLPFFFNS